MYIKNFVGEVINDDNRKIRFESSGFSNFTNDIVIELSKTPKPGFDEAGPCDLFNKLIKIPHIHFLLYHNFLIAIGYSYHSFDHKNNPDEKIYYKCYEHNLAHDDIPFKKYETFKPMSIDDVVDWVLEKKWDLQINHQDH
jgi:hypothetical protein